MAPAYPDFGFIFKQGETQIVQHYSHLATATNILWQLVEANGHDPVALYRDVGLDPDIRNKPGARILNLPD